MSIEALNGLTNYELLESVVGAEPPVVDVATTGYQMFEEPHVQADRAGESLWLQASARKDQSSCLVNALSA